MEIKINVPENCEPAMVTVVYRFKLDTQRLIEAVKAECAKPVEKPLESNGKPMEKWSCKTCGAEFDSIRSCRQHSRHCKKPKSKRGKGDHWTPEQIQYLIDHHGKEPHSDLAYRLGKTKGQCWDKWYYLKKTGRVPECANTSDAGRR